MKRTLAYLLVLVTVLVASFGCGGSTGGTGGGASRSVNVFVTDSFRDDYSHVWGTLYKIELITATDEATTIFDDVNGKVFDYASLNDSTGSRFAFLNKLDVPNSVFTKFRLTLSSTMRCVPTGNTNAQIFDVSGDGPPVSSKVVVTFDFPAPVNFITNDDLIIDFDLANFTVAGSTLTPSIKRGNRNGLDDLNRHEEDDIHGVVSGLGGTAPNLTFDLQVANNRFIKVKTTATTRIVNETGSPNPTLANGTRVEVTGRFETQFQQIVATEVKIEDEQGQQDDQKAKGLVTNVEAIPGTFKVTLGFARGFVPTSTFVNVATTNATVYLSHSGVPMSKADFFAALGQTGAMAEVEGTYSTLANTLTAKKAKIENENDNQNEVEAKGPVGTFNGTTGVLTLTPQEFAGWSFPGGVLEVVTTNTTVYQDDNNESMTKTQFFAALAQGTRVKVNGTLVNGTKVTARRLRLD